jgi:lipopolysaccharide export system protein LptC
MKNWVTAVFPITILGVLAALTYWLLHATAIPEVKSDGKNRHDPDYYISGMKLSKLDKSGNLKYTFTNDWIVHYPDDDTTDVTNPTLVFLSPRKPTLTMSSRMAHVTSEGEVVLMYDDVRFKRDATPLRAELLGYMPDLTINTEEEYLFTSSPVRFKQGSSWLNGVGMHMDHKTETYQIKSKAVGEFESRRAKAKP